MNKSELVEAVGSTAGVEKKVAERTVEAFVDTVMTEVRSGNKVTLIGFGTFAPRARAARTGRNPRTGEPVRVKASKGVGFSPGSAFKAALNTRGSGRAAPSKATATKATATRATATRAAPARSSAAKAAPAKSAGAKAPASKYKATTARVGAGRATTAKAGAAKAGAAKGTSGATGASSAKSTGRSAGGAPARRR